MGELNRAGSMDYFDTQETRLAIIAHGGPSMGHVVMRSVEGDILTTTDITYDHQEIGGLVRDDRGMEALDEVLYTNLDAEQQRIYDELVAAGVLPERSQRQ